jgi:hypothetical protein
MNLDQPNEGLLKIFFAEWLPLTFRISFVILLCIWVGQRLMVVLTQEYVSAPILVSSSASSYPWLNLLLLTIGIGTLMIALGAAGRIAALIILFSVGMYVNNFGLNITEALIVVCAAALLYLGTGPFSLWNPEQRIITRRLGEL